MLLAKIFKKYFLKLWWGPDVKSGRAKDGVLSLPLTLVQELFEFLRAVTRDQLDPAAPSLIPLRRIGAGKDAGALVVGLAVKASQTNDGELALLSGKDAALEEFARDIVELQP